MGGFVFHRADGCGLLRVIQPAGGHTCRRIHKFRGMLELLSAMKHMLFFLTQSNPTPESVIVYSTVRFQIVIVSVVTREALRDYPNNGYEGTRLQTINQVHVLDLSGSLYLLL